MPATLIQVFMKISCFVWPNFPFNAMTFSSVPNFSMVSNTNFIIKNCFASARFYESEKNEELKILQTFKMSMVEQKKVDSRGLHVQDFPGPGPARPKAKLILRS